MGKINKELLPIKAHFFFFMAAMGPILPQLSVYGKELGISSVVMGSVTGVLPILFLLAKPAFGLLVDVCRNYRKAIFMGLVVVTSLSYALLYFIPARFVTTYDFKNISCLQLDTCNVADYAKSSECNITRGVICSWICDGVIGNTSLYGLVHTNSFPSEEYTSNNICVANTSFSCNSTCDIKCNEDIETNTDCLYQSSTFWSFIILMSLGTIGFNVLNSISDAICFDIIGDKYDYGKQRVWGTIGFGITALISGYVVDYFSGGQLTYAPAFIVMLICTGIDFVACIKLELPVMEAPDNIFKDLKKLLNNRHTIIFIVFATLAGVVDSFIIYFLFWYLEDLAIMTNTTNIKLLEGLTVAAETLGAEVIFFYLSGKILERFGHGHSFSMCFINYGLRFGLISVIPSPWWIIPIEFAMQGPTYALTYTTIVAYANAISPPGMTATMQGIAAGMDDGFGYAVGSVIGGLLYKYVGGKGALQIFSAFSVTCGVAHLILYKTVLQHHDDPTTVSNKAKYLSPEDAVLALSDDHEKQIKQ